MALETFDGAAGVLPSPPWTDLAVGTAWRRNGSGAAQPTATGQNCLAAYAGAGQGDPLVLTYGAVGGGDDYIGVACFIQGSGGSADWYSVEVALGTSVISLNLFVDNNYAGTVTSWATPGSVNQAAGDKIEVTCSLVGGDPHFAIRYYDASAGTWSVVTAGYTDTSTGSPPLGTGFGMYAYAGTSITSVLVNEWDDGNAASSPIDVALSSLDARASLQAPTVQVSGPINVSLGSIDARASLQAPAVRRDITVALSPIDARAIWGGSLGVALPLGPIDGRASFQAPAVQLGSAAPIEVALGSIDARASTQAPDVRRAISVMLPTTDARALWQDLEVRRDITAGLAAIDARASLISPSVRRAISAALDPIDARAQFVAPDVQNAITVMLPALDARAILVAPDVELYGPIYVGLAVIDARATLQAPTPVVGAPLALNVIHRPLRFTRTISRTVRL